MCKEIIIVIGYMKDNIIILQNEIYFCISKATQLFWVFVNTAHLMFAIVLLGFKSPLFHQILCFKKLFYFGVINEQTKGKKYIYMIGCWEHRLGILEIKGK